MNPIAIKHRDSWPDSKETYVFDWEKVKLIVFHGTMFFDDDKDVYGIIEHDGNQHWIASEYLNSHDYSIFTDWLKKYFDIISIQNEDELPTVVWPVEHAGTLFFEPSITGRVIGNVWLFPACYEKRKVTNNLRKWLA